MQSRAEHDPGGLVSSEEPLDLSKSPARESFGFLLAMAAHRMRARFERELEPMGLEVKHFVVLATIRHFGPVPQQRLGSSVCIDRSSMVALIDEMERRGLVRRQRDPEDRRAYQVHLTEEGRRAFERAEAASWVAQDDCLGDLSVEQRAELKWMLQRIAEVDGTSGFELINIKVRSGAGDVPGRVDQATGEPSG